jgi:cytidyltransferase-like protein
MNWEVKNHGGEPTTNESKKYAIFIGRFQPPHKGHLELINQKIKDNVPVLIMVRDIKPDEKNPLTTEQTIFLLDKHYLKKSDDIKIISIPDIESVNFGRGVGYEVNEFIPPKNIGGISATEIRNSIKNGDDNWKEMIDVSMQDDIFNFLVN